MSNCLILSSLMNSISLHLLFSLMDVLVSCGKEEKVCVMLSAKLRSLSHVSHCVPTLKSESRRIRRRAKLHDTLNASVPINFTDIPLLQQAPQPSSALAG